MPASSADVLRLQKLVLAILDMMALGVKPTKRKVIQRIGGGINSNWFNTGFEELKLLSDNFTNAKPIERKFGVKQTRSRGFELMAENQQLKNHIDHLEEQLIKVEPLNADLCFKVQVLETQLKEKDIGAKAIQAELEKTIDNKQAQIDSLYQELAETHKENMSQAREFGFAVDDRIVQKQVEIVNLQDKLKKFEQKVRLQAQELGDRKLQIEKLKAKVQEVEATLARNH